MAVGYSGNSQRAFAIQFVFDFVAVAARPKAPTSPAAEAMVSTAVVGDQRPDYNLSDGPPRPGVAREAAVTLTVEAEGILRQVEAEGNLSSRFCSTPARLCCAESRADPLTPAATTPAAKSFDGGAAAA